MCSQPVRQLGLRRGTAAVTGYLRHTIMQAQGVFLFCLVIGKTFRRLGRGGGEGQKPRSSQGKEDVFHDDQTAPIRADIQYPLGLYRFVIR